MLFLISLALFLHQIFCSAYRIKVNSINKPFHEDIFSKFHCISLQCYMYLCIKMLARLLIAAPMPGLDVYVGAISITMMQS